MEEIPSMPGISRFGVLKVVDHLRPLVSKGLKTILLFGVIETLRKVKHDFSSKNQKFCKINNSISAQIRIIMVYRLIRRKIR